MPSNCTLWMMDGKLVVDENGAPILSEDCPCGGDCCGKLVTEIITLLSQTTRYCVACEQGTWTEECGECEIPVEGSEQTQLGKWSVRRRNPLQTFDDTCSGFHIITPEPAGGYVEGQDVEIQVCEESTTVPYSYIDPYQDQQYSETPGAIMVKLFCPATHGSDDQIYPVIQAPDLPGIFGSAASRCQQQYWQSCFSPAPIAFISCGVQVIAPRSWFDDAPQSAEPDDTMVWGVIGCFCEGDDKWKIRRLCGGAGNGYIVVNSPFTPDLTPKLDGNGNPVRDDQGNVVQVVSCAITCQGQKDLVKEMMNHYQISLTQPKSAIRATTDTNEWNAWTGQSVSGDCFWGYVPLSAVYGYVCSHPNEQGVMTQYKHWLLFDCDCNLSDLESVYSGGGLTLPDSGIYETDESLCDSECPYPAALKAFAEGEGWSKSTSGDPLDTGTEGVIITEDSRAPGGGVYVIGGSAAMYAIWSDNDHMLIWVDCDCGLHVECTTTLNKKFLYYQDACTCLDWREIVDDHANLFGVVDKQWGSHVIVQWTHTSASASYEGPYWLYNTSNDEVVGEVWCDECTHQNKGTYKKYYNAFIDWNMLVVHRIVSGEHEIGHVQKTGGIINYRLNASGSTMAGVTAAQVRSIFPDMCSYDPVSECCPNGSSGAGTFGGWYIEPYSYSMMMMFGTSLDCHCEYDPSDLPICSMHSYVLKPDTMYLTGANRDYHRCYPLVTVPRQDTVPGQELHNCDGTCVWEPSRINWTIFTCSYFRTSCGLLVNGEQDKYYLPSLFIPGYTGTTALKAIAAVERQYGYFNGIVHDPNSVYPSDDQVVTAYPPNNAQPELCHGTRCGGYTQYASLDAYCAQFSSAATKPTECECLLDATSSECLDIEPPSSN